MEALAGVVTDATSRAEACLAVVGTPITSMVSLAERRDSKDATAQVFAAADLCAHASTQNAALAGELSTRHAVAIARVLADLPAGLDAAQRLRAEQLLLAESAVKTRRLCCDADITAVVLGSASETLDVGRTQRLVTPGIRMALSHRDKGCVFPGCRQPDSRCEAHHIVPWAEGGATALSNLVLVCPHHHRLLEPDPHNQHRDRWRVSIDDRGRPIVEPTVRLRALLSRTPP